MLPYSSRVLRGKKFGEFGESSMIHRTKLVLTINNLLADLLFRQTFSKCLKRVNSPNFLTIQYACYIWWWFYFDCLEDLNRIPKLKACYLLSHLYCEHGILSVWYLKPPIWNAADYLSNCQMWSDLWKGILYVQLYVNV